MKTVINPFIRGFHKVEPCLQSAVLLFLRVLIGWQFFETGRGKLAHLDKTRGFFEGLGLPAPGFHAGLVGIVETTGGILILVGLATRLISVPLLVTMVVAYLTAHRAEAFKSFADFTSQTPFPFLAVLLVLLAFGPGRWSVDSVLGRREPCPP